PLLSTDCATPAMPASFSLHTTRTRRGLPSFPTRRSSDLGQQAAWDARVQHLAVLDDAPVRHPDRAAHRGDPAAEQERTREPEQGDRKSTRLNSSHLGISYAVFCLKKKNKKLERKHNLSC